MNLALPSPTSALVLPSQLAADAAEAVRELLAEAAANTTRSYATALRCWAGWYKMRFGQEFTPPLSEAQVMQFVVDHVVRRNKDGYLAWELPTELDKALVASGLRARLGPRKLSSIDHGVAVLSTAHRLKRPSNPCEMPSSRTVLSRARRASVKRGERPAKKTAIAKSELEAMLATCDDSMEGIRDCALLCFGFSSGGRRRSEIAAANLRDLKRTGPSAYIYRLEHSKTQQAGVTASSTPDKPILDRSADALTAWLDASGIKAGAMFRRLWRNRVGPALSAAAVSEIVQRRAKRAGLAGNYGGHSLRSGFVTEAGLQGVPLPAVMAMTEHRSVASIVGYFQAGSAEQNPASRLLE